jgi:hypothetical protein
MASLDVIRTLTIKARTEGVQQAASDLNKLADAEKNVAQASVQTERATLSVEKAFQRLERQLDGTVRAQAQMAQARKVLDAATAQGLVSQQRAGDLMQMAMRQFNSGAEATQKYANSQKLARFELINLSRQLQDVGVSLASGQGLFTVAIQQGSQIADVFQTSGVSLGGFARQVGGMLTPMRLLVGGVGLAAAAIAGMAKIWADAALQFDNLSKRLDAPIGKLQALAGAAQIKGIDTDAFVKGMEQFGDQVSLAQQGLGSLNDLLRINGQTAGTVEESFFKVADLVKNARNEVDKLNILQAAGLPRTQEWVRLMEQGAEGVRKAAEAMGDSGIDPRMVQSAREFTEAWNKAWAAFKITGLAVVGDILAGLTSLATSAGNFLSDASGLIPTQASEQRAFTRADEEALIELGRKRLIQMGQTKEASEALGASEKKNADQNKTVTVEQIQAQEKALNLEKQRISMLGNLATTQQKVRAVEIDIQLARLKGVQISKQEEEALKKNAELGGQAGTKLKELKEDYSEVENAVSNFASTLIHSMLDGATATEALGHALEGLGRQLINIGTQDFAKSIGGSIEKLLPSLAGAIPGFGGLATAGIGAGISLISKLFSGEDDKKAQEAARKQEEELQRARDAWAAMTQQLKDFNREAAGLAKGALTSTIDTLTGSFNQLAAAAIKAQNFAAYADLLNTFNAAISRLIGDFLKSLPTFNQMLRSEGGLSGATSSAIASVKTFRDSVSGLIDSLRTVGERTGAWALVAEETAKIQQSAQVAALDMLNVQKKGAQEQSEFAKELSRLMTVSKELQAVMVELGLSAEAAAAAIDEKLTESINALRGQFLEELTRQVNALAGGEWINQAQDLARQVAQMRQDAADLGIQTSLIDTFFVLSAQKIVDQNELTGASFEALVNSLGLAGTSLHEFNDVVEETANVVKRSMEEIARAIQSNEDRLFLALHRSDSLADQLARFDLQAQREREEEARLGGQAMASLEAALAQERLNIVNDFYAKLLQQQLDAQRKAAEEAERARQKQIEEERRQAEERQRILEEATRFLQGALRRISEWISNFLSGTQSPLSPSARLAQAQSAFQTNYTQALAGNRDALQGITSNAQDLVDAVRAYYGSSAAGQTLINTLLSQLQALPSLVSPEQFIVDELTPPLEDVSTGIEDQSDLLQTLFNNLTIAVQSGSATAIASALLPVFNSIDANTDQAIDLNEMIQALGSSFSSGTLASIFQTLDLNGDGQLSQLELIKTATQGTQTGTTTVATNTSTIPTVNTNTANTALSTAQAVTQLGLINASTALLSSIDTRALSIAGSTASTDTQMVTVAQGTSRIPFVESFTSELPNIRSNTGVIAGWAPGSNHEMGGLLTGPRHSAGGIPLGGGHFAEGGEYIMSRKTVSRIGVGPLNAMNFTGASAPSNDNMFTLMRGLERNLMRGIKALIDTQLEAAGIIARPIEEQNKLQRTRRGEKKVA